MNEEEVLCADRDEAADALHDAFLAASAHLDQLRDPSRLRPWLYSICRHESLKRARRRSRVELVDEVDEMSTFDVDMDRGSRAEELQELVWSAAAGLNARDQALLDLNLRQGLEGQDLADAMGTSLNNSYVMLSRLRDQVERSLGALLIARLGRDDCDELASFLEGWDGAFSPLIRKRVARHVDGCDVCSERRAAAVSPLALLAAAPLVPAPSELRSRVLDGIGGQAPAEPISFTRAGFAADPDGSRPRGRAWLVAAVVLLVAVVAGGLAVAQDDDAPTLAATGEGTSTTEEAVTTTSERPTTTTSTSTPEIAPPSSADPLAPPSSQDPVVIPAPDTTPPVIGPISESADTIYQSGTACTPHSATITVPVEGATKVTLRWNSAPLMGARAMTASVSTWSTALGPFPASPDNLQSTLAYTVVARDAAGNESTRTGSIDVDPCPG